MPICGDHSFDTPSEGDVAIAAAKPFADLVGVAARDHFSSPLSASRPLVDDPAAALRSTSVVAREMPRYAKCCLVTELFCPRGP